MFLPCYDRGCTLIWPLSLPSTAQTDHTAHAPTAAARHRILTVNLGFVAANPANKQRDSNDPPNGEIELPTLGRRFGALLIDWALCLLVANLYGEPTRDGWSPIVALIFIYTVFAGFFAQTPAWR